MQKDSSVLLYLMQLYWFCNIPINHNFILFIIVNEFAKSVLYAHSFKSQFPLPLDRYNNRLTVHAYTKYTTSNELPDSRAKDHLLTTRRS